MTSKERSDMKDEVSQLRQNRLQAERVLDAIETQRSELSDKIKQAITNGATQDLPELRGQLVALEAGELPVAQTAVHEAAIKFYESEAVEHEREAVVLHERLDEVFGRRDRRMKEISDEFHALQLDQSGEISEARRLLMNAQNAITQSKEQAQQYRERLAKLQAKQQQQSAAL